MNVLVIGLGSMGKRRLRLLKKYFKDLNITGVDFNADRRTQCEDDYRIKTYSTLDEAFTDNRYDCGFVCTSPLSHSEIIRCCLENSINIFSEINLVSDGYKSNSDLAKTKNLKIFQSSTALYRKEIQYLTDTINHSKQKFCYNYHVGQYLPDWHPWENYLDFFVGDKKTNGCREILALELPWIVKAFGRIASMNVISARFTSLKIDYDDTYLIQFIHDNGCKGNLLVDVVCRNAVRSLKIFNEHNYFEWEGSPNTLKVKNLQSMEMENVSLYNQIDKLEGYNEFIIENHYLDEIVAFLEYIKNIKEPIYTLNDDKYVLDVIDEIESYTNNSGY